MKKLESKIESLETEITELKNMVALLVDNIEFSMNRIIKGSHNSQTIASENGTAMSQCAEAGHDVSQHISNSVIMGNNSSGNQAGRDLHVINIYLNGEDQEMLTLLKGHGVGVTFPT